MRGPDWLWLGLLYECRNPACTTGPRLIDRQGGASVLLEACCWLLYVCVLLQNSSVQPWFHLIQFPSNPLSVQSCPLSFLHPDNFIFYFSPLSSLPSDDPAVNSAFHSCNSPSLPPPPPPPLSLLLLPVSFMMWRSMMCPWPRYESLSSSPQQALLTHNSPTLPNPLFPLFFLSSSVFSISKSFAHWQTSLLFLCQIPYFGIF